MREGYDERVGVVALAEASEEVIEPLHLLNYKLINIYNTYFNLKS